MRFYIDTCIWIDFLNNREGFNGEKLADYAERLFSILKLQNHTIIITDILLHELESKLSLPEINGIFKPFRVEKIITMREQRDKAKKIAYGMNIPPGDILHTLIARENNLILITRDKHFKKLENISKSYKPEEALIEFFT